MFAFVRNANISVCHTFCVYLKKMAQEQIRLFDWWGLPQGEASMVALMNSVWRAR